MTKRTCICTHSLTHKRFLSRFPVGENLAVDLTTGEIESDSLPGVEWVVRPSASTRHDLGRRRKRSSATHLEELCSIQGVLKFTFTPPPPDLRKLRHSRGRHHHRRHRGGSNGGGDDGGGGDGDSHAGRRKLLLELEFRRPRRWVFNLGDSIANNGFCESLSVCLSLCLSICLCLKQSIHRCLSK